MSQTLLVFLGGGLGSACRYLVSKIITKQWELTFPLGTFIVNVIGCFLIGLILATADKYKLHSHLSLILSTGFCGGFTTFSTFIHENNILFNQQDYLTFIIYILASIITGFIATFIGIYVVKFLL